MSSTDLTTNTQPATSYKAQAWIASIAFAVIALVAVIFLIDVFVVEAKVNSILNLLSGLGDLVGSQLGGE